MEEDIEILENYCKALQGKHLDNRVRAIQNLLQAYKEDEAVINLLAEEEYKRDELYYRQILGVFSKENLIEYLRKKGKDE